MTSFQTEAELTLARGESGDLAVEERDVPTYLVDSVIGFVTAGDLPRVTLGQLAFRRRGELPAFVPQLTLAVPKDALVFLATQLMQIAEAGNGAVEGGEGGETPSE